MDAIIVRPGETIATDGIESNRMRYSTSALFTLVLLERTASILRRRNGKA